MNISDVFSAAAIAVQQTEAASNRMAYLGEGFFLPRRRWAWT